MEIYGEKEREGAIEREIDQERDVDRGMQGSMRRERESDI